MEYSILALTLSRSARQSLLQAMTFNSTLQTTSRRTTNIRRIRSQDTTTSSQEKALIANLGEALQNSWWIPDGGTGMATPVGNPSSSAATMDPLVVQSWIKQHSTSSLLTTNESLLIQRLKCWNVLLSEWATERPHSTTVWWKHLIPSLVETLEISHGRRQQRQGSSQLSQERKKQDTSSTTKGGIVRRIRETTTSEQRGTSRSTPTLTNNSTKEDAVAPMELENDANANPVDEDCLLGLCLSVVERLLHVTKTNPVLKEWFDGDDDTEMQDSTSQTPPKGQGLVVVSMVLDLLEEVTSSIRQTPSSELHELPSWYLDAVAFLHAVGSTKPGMKVLRTRMVIEEMGVMLPNALDVAVQQWHMLSLLENNVAPELAIGKPPRKSTVDMAMESWIRLWHQVLLFVHEQDPTNDKANSTFISFRSLLEDHQDEYTSACARVLTNQNSSREIQCMIRLQLEELSMDEEEHEEMKQQQYGMRTD